jgi:hypothetical protein
VRSQRRSRLDSLGACLLEPGLGLRQIFGRRGRRRVAAVGERVQDQLRNALAPGQLDACPQVLEARMHAARGDEPHQVQAPALIPGCAARRAKRLVLHEAAIGDRVVDAGQVLLHDRPGPEVQVPYLGIAHLTGWQPDRLPGRVELGVRIRLPERVEDRCRGERDRIAGARGRDAPAVEDDEHDRWQGHRGAAATIAANATGSRLAPPTSAPSTSGRLKSSAALSALTLPP